jgi:hypothetical protein
LPSAMPSAKRNTRQRTSLPSVRRSAKDSTRQRATAEHTGRLPSVFAERPPLGARQRWLKGTYLPSADLWRSTKNLFLFCFFQTFLSCITHYFKVYVKFWYFFKSFYYISLVYLI